MRYARGIIAEVDRDRPQLAGGKLACCAPSGRHVKFNGAESLCARS